MKIRNVLLVIAVATLVGLLAGWLSLDLINALAERINP